LREFIRVGEIDGETVVINTCDGTRRQIREMPDLWETATQSEADENQIQIQLGDPVGPAVAKMSIRLQERIRDLEQTLQEERRALAESQQRYNELERKYQDLLLRDLS
jgi:tRNA/tmRNA/rRNA uracil-C5-methylase (TrmA/RlmC/RlmD family)